MKTTDQDHHKIAEALHGIADQIGSGRAEFVRLDRIIFADRDPVATAASGDTQCFKVSPHQVVTLSYSLTGDPVTKKEAGDPAEI